MGATTPPADRGQRAAVAGVPAAPGAAGRVGDRARVPAGYRLAIVPPTPSTRTVRAAGRARAARALRGRRPGDRGAAAAARRWRCGAGPALADVADAPFAAAAVARLEELRLTATEDRVEAELALRPAAPTWSAELRGARRRHPLRERLRGLLMRALYAAGRQAEALAAYEDSGARLADELGVDPVARAAATSTWRCCARDPVAAAARPHAAHGRGATCARR